MTTTAAVMVLFTVLSHEDENIEHLTFEKFPVLVGKEKYREKFSATRVKIRDRTGYARLNLLLVPGAGVIPSSYTIRNGMYYSDVMNIHYGFIFPDVSHDRLWLLS